jgi:hypothetical protein
VSEDALLRCFNWQRECDRSWRRRLWLRDDSLAAGGVELVKRTATARVIVRAQYQREFDEQFQRPESHSERVRFYPWPQPRPPREPNIEERTERFPLDGTLRRMPCPACDGSGTLLCPNCKPSTRASCGHCRSTGRVRDSRCEGEGRLACWVERVYQYFSEAREGDVWCFQKPSWRLPRVHSRWIKAHGTPVASWDEAVLSERLEYLTDGVRDVAEQASGVERRFLAEARDAHENADWLFSVVTRYIVPVAHVTTRHGQRGERYVLVGSGDNVLEVPARQRLDPIKLLAWSSAATLLLGPLGLASHLLPETAAALVLWLMSFADGWLAAGVGLTLAGAVVPGLLRILRGPSLPRTVVLLPVSGQRTGLLTCLAYLGSHARSFMVLDTDCEPQLARLTGQDTGTGGTENVTLRLRDGSVTRLIEVCEYGALSDEQLERVARNADSLIVVTTPGAGAIPPELLERLPELLERLRRSREGAPQVASLRLERRASTAPPQAASALEDVLSAYRNGGLSDERCAELVQRLWSAICLLADREDPSGGVTCYLD